MGLTAPPQVDVDAMKEVAGRRQRRAQKSSSYNISHPPEVSPMLSMLRRLYALTLRYWRYLYPAPQPQVDFAYYDSKGQGYIRSPDWMKATSPDEGQWDSLKRLMRIALWRARYGLSAAPGQLDMRPIGVASRPLGLPAHITLASQPSRGETVPALWPFHGTLALGCRELGFRRLALAAMPDIDIEMLKAIYQKNQGAILTEAEAMHARNVATRSSPPPGFNLSTFTFETVDELMALMSTGDFDRPDLADCPPLCPLALGIDGEAMPESPQLQFTPPTA